MYILNKHRLTFRNFFQFSQLFTQTQLFCNFSRLYPTMDTMTAPSAQPQEPKRRVSFHPSTKEHDGLSKDSHVLNEYMRDAFGTVERRPGEKTIEVLAMNLKLEALTTLKNMLTDVILRCETSLHGSAIILNKGGGCCGSIPRKYIPWLVSHVQYLEEVISTVQLLRKGGTRAPGSR